MSCLLQIGQSNRVLRAILKALYDLWGVAWTLDYADDQIDELVRQHVVIGEAVIAGDQRAAEHLMREHIELAMETDISS